MKNILENISVGSKIVTNGQVHTITEDLGDGVFEWIDTQVPPAVGTFEFDTDTTENLNLTII